MADPMAEPMDYQLAVLWAVLMTVLMDLQWGVATGIWKVGLMALQWLDPLAHKWDQKMAHLKTHQWVLLKGIQRERLMNWKNRTNWKWDRRWVVPWEILMNWKHWKD